MGENLSNLECAFAGAEREVEGCQHDPNTVEGGENGCWCCCSFHVFATEGVMLLWWYRLSRQKWANFESKLSIMEKS
ncbi:hypothetical protein KSB_59050 [Ktedonobacter robiniae]|uniref:Uncharacterized protein n=1 Tax=Ktedonobacter robiniae TaxID=2778365 RepID=A0ABQ3UYR3_9CHLR|nr:hypothetical protein KSB_59050 [Ktedonobacter robiniae]